MTAFHSQIDAQIEMNNNTLEARILHYVAEHHRSWGAFVQSFTYVYNTRIYLLIKFRRWNLWHYVDSVVFSIVLFAYRLGLAFRGVIPDKHAHATTNHGGQP